MTNCEDVYNIIEDKQKGSFGGLFCLNPEAIVQSGKTISVVIKNGCYFAHTVPKRPLT
jgi:hypothetical protein